MTVKHKHYKWSQINQDDISWCEKAQELTVDLSKQVEAPMRLILTSWQQGISWKTLINEEQEHHLNPFKEPPFPFDFLERDVLKSWQDLIPGKLLQHMHYFKINAFGMLSLCSRYQYANELFASNPILFWLLFVDIQKGSQDEAEFLVICRLKQTDILKSINLTSEESAAAYRFKQTEIFKSINLPSEESALILLSKIKSEHYAQKEYRLIHALLTVNFEKLNDSDSISIAQIIECIGHKERIITLIIEVSVIIFCLDCNDSDKKSMQQELDRCPNEQAVRKLRDDLRKIENKKHGCKGTPRKKTGIARFMGKGGRRR